VADMIRDGE
ncbi:hypothetical protein Tco_1292818, partial [Tanacetum coccineum]